MASSSPTSAPPAQNAAAALPAHDESRGIPPDDSLSISVPPEDDPLPSPRATRSSFPLQQNGEAADDTAKESHGAAFGDRHYKATWKDEWVVSLIHLRGSMNDDFNKPQKSGIDIWSRVSAQMTEAHHDFDKNGESCRKKWQRIYKSYKSFKYSKALPAATGSMDKQCTCKWFDLVDRYMHNQTDNATENEQDDAIGTSSRQNRSKNTGKCARRDEEIKESLSEMVETWRESLEVLRDSEAKRLATLQRLSGTMTGLLDVLRK